MPNVSASFIDDYVIQRIVGSWFNKLHFPSSFIQVKRNLYLYCTYIWYFDDITGLHWRITGMRAAHFDNLNDVSRHISGNRKPTFIFQTSNVYSRRRSASDTRHWQLTRIGARLDNKLIELLELLLGWWSHEGMSFRPVSAEKVHAFIQQSRR